MPSVELTELRSELQNILARIARPLDDSNNDIDWVVDDMLIAARETFIATARRRCENPRCPPTEVVVGPPPTLASYGIDTLYALLEGLVHPPGLTANQWGAVEAIRHAIPILKAQLAALENRIAELDADAEMLPPMTTATGPVVDPSRRN
jgi:hypothetical protein